MQNIGLMMTYNEDDVLDECLTHLKQFFDCILVLDGSTDRTEEILRSHAHVRYILKEDQIFPKRRIRDGCRQFLLEKAQEMYGTEGWFTLLHADEFFVDDPNEIAARASRVKAEKVNWHMLTFFLHESERGQIWDPNRSIREQRLFYSLGGLEIRQFRNKPGIYYDLNQHSDVLPKGIGWKPLLDFPVIAHYANRSPEQMQKKYDHQNRMVHIGDSATPFHQDSVYRTHYYMDRTTVRKFDGSFHELAPKARPGILKQWLQFQKY